MEECEWDLPFIMGEGKGEEEKRRERKRREEKGRAWKGRKGCRLKASIKKDPSIHNNCRGSKRALCPT